MCLRWGKQTRASLLGIRGGGWGREETKGWEGASEWVLWLILMNYT